MEELHRLHASRKAFKGHITRLHHKMDELMSEDFDDYTISSLTTTIEQIKVKGDKVTQMDEKIAVLINDATDLESTMYEAEALQDEIVDKIARATRYINSSRRSPSPLSDTSQQSEISQSQFDEATNVSAVEIYPVSTSSIVESGSANIITSTVQAETVSAIATSSIHTFPVITSSSTTPPAVIPSVNYVNESCSAERVIPMTTMTYSTNLGPPPLIPAETSGIVSQHRPTSLSTTLLTPHRFNELPITTHQQVLPVMSASRHLYESPPPVTQHSLAAPLISTHSAAPSHHSQMLATSRNPAQPCSTIDINAFCCTITPFSDVCH